MTAPVTFYRAEEYVPDDPRQADRIAGWVGYTLPTARTPWGSEYVPEVLVPVYAGAVCELPRRTA